MGVLRSEGHAANTPLDFEIHWLRRYPASVRHFPASVRHFPEALLRCSFSPLRLLRSASVRHFPASVHHFPGALLRCTISLGLCFRLLLPASVRHVPFLGAPIPWGPAMVRCFLHFACSGRLRWGDRSIHNFRHAEEGGQL
jgi:hypothetical protein